MLSVYICEDNPHHLMRYKTIIENLILMEEFDIKLQAAVTNPEELLYFARLHQQDSGNGGAFYLLDIHLNADMDGFQLAQSIRQFDSRSFIAFITTHSELAMLTFQYQIEAMDYILKDESWNVGIRIRTCLENALARYHAFTSVPMISFKTASRTIHIPEHTILYIRSSTIPHEIHIVTRNGVHVLYGSLKYCMEHLSSDFVRCNKSMILNIQCIDYIDGKTLSIVLTNGESHTASTRGISRVASALHKGC